MNRVCIAVVLLLLVAGAPAARQSAPGQIPAFRTGVDAVQIDVTVLDRDRRPVRGLTASDFTILEDGKPRPIVAFSPIDLPPLAAAAPSGLDAIAPDVVRNDVPSGRIVVIVIDPFLERAMVPGRVTIADPPGLAALRATAMRLIDSLGPGDLGAVAHTVYGVAQNLTADKQRLKRAVESSAYGTIKRGEADDWGSCQCGTCRVDALTAIATALRGEPQRRKIIFYVGERFRLSPVADACNNYLEPATRKMVNATQLANVTVHTIDPNSLETTNVHAGDDFKPEGGPAAAGAQERANRAFLIERQQSLQTVADWTGGRAVMNTNAPEESVRPILEESSAYYLIAFGTDAKADKRFHPITVRVNRPGVLVRTRKGYFAETVSAGSAATDASASLDALSRELLPLRGLPMSIAAAPFRHADGAPIVVVATGVRTGAAPPDKAGPAGDAPTFEPIEILTSAFGEGVKDSEWHRQRVSIAVPDTAPGELRYESISMLRLKPGSYEVRVVTRNAHAGLVGSVHTFVDVPDFEDSAMSLSGVVLVDRTAPTVTPLDALGGVLAAAPTTRRTFSTGDTVVALLRVYQKRGSTPAPVSVVFRVLDEQLREVLSASQPLAPDAFAAGNASAESRFELPLQRLTAGSYVLRIDASGAEATARREVRFSVK